MNPAEPVAEASAPPIDMAALQSDMNAANVVSVICLSCVTVLFRYCVATYRTERELLRNTPPSFGKYAFRVNRYLSPICLLVLWISLSGFKGLELTDGVCQCIIIQAITLFVLSSALGNYLIAVRVVSLWDHNLKVIWLMRGAYVTAYSATLGITVVEMVRMRSSMVWNDLSRMCVVNRINTPLIATSVTPLLFELLALIMISVNALDRPRQAHEPLTKSLSQDGVTFFAAVTALRVFYLAFIATKKGYLTMMASIVVWTALTLLLTRVIFALRKNEILNSGYDRPSTVFTAERLGREVRRARENQASAETFNDRRGQMAWVPGEEIELGQVQVEFAQR